MARIDLLPKRNPSTILKSTAGAITGVEVDQWFWSLFAGDKVVLPRSEVVQGCADSVPNNFKFCVKVPNSITLTHHYKEKKTDLRLPNPCFLSPEFMFRFLVPLEPLFSNLGPLIIQFEYLNKRKMLGGLNHFKDVFGKFVKKTTSRLPILP